MKINRCLSPYRKKTYFNSFRIDEDILINNNYFLTTKIIKQIKTWVEGVFLHHNFKSFTFRLIIFLTKFIRFITFIFFITNA